MFNKILCVGFGENINIITHLPNTNEFIFMDTLPRGEKYKHKKFIYSNYKERFVNNLLNQFSNCGFYLDYSSCTNKLYYKNIMSWKQRIYAFIKGIPNNINPTLLVFSNDRTKQVIKYYISTNINHNITANLFRDINTCDGIVISDHDPDIKILNYLETPMNFIGYTHIDYSNPKYKHSEDSILKYIHDHEPNIHFIFDKYYLIDNKTGYIEYVGKKFVDFYDKVKINTSERIIDDETFYEVFDY